MCTPFKPIGNVFKRMRHNIYEQVLSNHILDSRSIQKRIHTVSLIILHPLVNFCISSFARFYDFTSVSFFCEDRKYNV